MKACFLHPGKREDAERKTNMEDFGFEVIRNTVIEFYTVRKEIPTEKAIASS